MRSISAVVGACLAAVAIAGCSSSNDSAPAKQTATPTSRSTPSSIVITPPSSPAEGFVAGLKRAGVPVGDTATMGRIAEQICAGFDQVPDGVNMSMQVARESDGMYTADEAAKIVGGAIAWYCPERQDAFHN